MAHLIKRKRYISASFSEDGHYPMKIPKRTKSRWKKRNTERTLVALGGRSGCQGTVNIARAHHVTTLETTPESEITPPDTDTSAEREMTPPGTDTSAESEMTPPDTDTSAQSEMTPPDTDTSAESEMTPPDTDTSAESEMSPPDTDTSAESEMTPPDTDTSAESEMTPPDTDASAESEMAASRTLEIFPHESEISQLICDGSREFPFIAQDMPSEMGECSRSTSNEMTEDLSRLMILAFQLKHGITGAALKDLLKLIPLLDGRNQFSSKYLFEKPFTDVLDVLQFHHYCMSCKQYLGVPNTKDKVLSCGICATKVTVKESTDRGYFFIHIPLQPQLNSLLNLEGMGSSLFSNWHNNGFVSDFADGCMYTTFRETHSEDHILTLTFSCDGVPVFNSSKFSIWPILCSVNEIPPHKRDKHLLLCGLWFGSHKPDMQNFLTPFVRECKGLSEHGFQWQDQKNKSIKSVKVYALCGVCDSVAKPMLQNFKQFNGEYGCSFCLHPGEHLRKGNGMTRVYPCTDDVPEKRAHQTTVELGEVAQQKDEIILGVKGHSVLASLPSFDLINGMVPDYMHCVLLGVCRQVAKLWFDSKNHGNAWYIGNETKRIDYKLVSILPTNAFSRLPRSITLKKFWKAHEWQACLLYYSLPVLQDILPKKYLTHWALLVEGISILLGDSITDEQVKHAHDALVYFVVGFECLYGKENMSFNVHLLLHISDSVMNWGPLWAHSAFLFENYNGHLLAQVKSSKAVPLQICKRILLERALPHLAKPLMSNASSDAQAFFSEMTSSKHHVQKFEHFKDITALGAPKVREISVSDMNSLQCLRDVSPNSIVRYYSRIVVNGEIIHSKSYRKTTKRNNSVVILKDGSIFRICHFICLGEIQSDSLFAVGHIGKSVVQKLAKGEVVKTQLKYIKNVHFPPGFRRAVDCENIVRPCLLITCAKSGNVACEVLKTYGCK